MSYFEDRLAALGRWLDDTRDRLRDRLSSAFRPGRAGELFGTTGDRVTRGLSSLKEGTTGAVTTAKQRWRTTDADRRKAWSGRVLLGLVFAAVIVGTWFARGWMRPRGPSISDGERQALQAVQMRASGQDGSAPSSGGFRSGP